MWRRSLTGWVITMLLAVERHADTVAAAQTLATKTGSKLWRQVSPANISGSWRFLLRELVPAVSNVQVRVAESASEYGAAALAEQGVYQATEAFVNPSAFGGVAPDGLSMEGLLWSPVVRSKSLIGQGVPVDDALASAGKQLSTILRTVVADTGRQAESVDIASRKDIGYTRVIVGETCPDCVILAGRFYLWNKGFARHPGCDCIHVQTTRGLSEKTITDPYAHFESLSEAEQNQFWGEADAQAIRDGADIYQVYNARRRTAKDGLTTLTGTTRRAHMGGMDVRLTPEGIYQQAKNRGEALQMLEANGYILPGGQTPGGVLRGNNIGYAGYMGRGGTRRGATQAFQEAVRTGNRDPNVVATMTAAERRLFDAQLRWDAVRQGRNPYGGTLTPKVAAKVETDYRRWLRTGGNIF